MALTERLEALSRAMDRNCDLLDSGTFFMRKLTEIRSGCPAARIILAAYRADRESRAMERRIARANHPRNMGV